MKISICLSFLIEILKNILLIPYGEKEPLARVFTILDAPEKIGAGSTGNTIKENHINN